MLVAVHVASLTEAVTATGCVPPSVGAAQLVGVTVNVAEPAACVTVIACPATVAVALRLATLDGFAVAASVTLAVPVPPGALSVSQGCVLVAVHVASLSEAVTATVSVPPPVGTAQLAGVTVNVAEPAACVTVIACPATAAVALRLATLDGFAVAASVTLAVPVPPGALSVSQGCVLVAVHVASLSEAVTATVSVPPPVGTAQLVGVTVNVAVPAACVTAIA